MDPAFQAILYSGFINTAFPASQEKKKKSQTDISGTNMSFWQSRMVHFQIWEHPLLPTVWSKEVTGVFQCTLMTFCRKDNPASKLLTFQQINFSEKN